MSRFSFSSEQEFRREALLKESFLQAQKPRELQRPQTSSVQAVFPTSLDISAFPFLATCGEGGREENLKISQKQRSYPKSHYTETFRPHTTGLSLPITYGMPTNVYRAIDDAKPRPSYAPKPAIYQGNGNRIGARGGHGLHHTATHMSSFSSHSHTPSSPTSSTPSGVHSNFSTSRDYFLYPKCNILRIGGDFRLYRDHPKGLMRAANASEPIHSHRKMNDITNFQEQMLKMPYSDSEVPVMYGSGGSDGVGNVDLDLQRKQFDFGRGRVKMANGEGGRSKKLNVS